jgi:2-polyprenyl-3-methyl-5-hydroxy-6-metoxy-1,4-benzoquinol methylase
MRSEKILFRAPYVEKAYKIIRRNLSGLVLDIGCGDGIITYTHKPVVGIDIFQEKYVTKYKLKNKKFLIPLIIKGDMHNLPLKNNKFDCVVINHTLEHTDKPKIVLREIRRVLKRDGKLIVGVPNAGSIQSILTKHLLGTDSYAYSKDHKQFFDKKKLTNLLKSNGFKIESINGSAFHIHLIGKIFEFWILRKLAQFMGKFPRLSQDLIAIARNV